MRLNIQCQKLAAGGETFSVSKVDKLEAEESLFGLKYLTLEAQKQPILEEQLLL